MELFGRSHQLALVLIALVAFVCIVVGRRASEPTCQRLGYAIAACTLGAELLVNVYALYEGTWHYSWALPLQLCDLAVFAMVVTLISWQQRLWELAYFWGIAGSTQALLTPVMPRDFPDPHFICFFLSHGGVVVACAFLGWGLGRPLGWASVGRAWLVTNAYAVAILLLNGLLGTNYLFLCEKPVQSTLLDFFGPWPGYLIILEGLLTLMLCVAYGLYVLLSPRAAGERAKS